MTRVVLDASVAAKWWLPPEPGTAEAVALFVRHAAGAVVFAVPDLFWSEVANVFWKAAGRRRMTLEETRTAFGHLTQTQCTTVPAPPLLPQALDLSRGPRTAGGGRGPRPSPARKRGAPPTAGLGPAPIIALRYRCSVYDALYVATALESNAVLVTADEALARGLAAELPVKLLGAI